ncbi:DUF2690 domain-containing protein [Dactylosporangium sp. CA-052675]|uniref:DUF2690 domain-containing protein n=1 Tax=Dactylosporangium sp. CA-052675 TaxID=3239927 RepID=UPI003D9107A3
MSRKTREGKVTTMAPLRALHAGRVRPATMVVALAVGAVMAGLAVATPAEAATADLQRCQGATCTGLDPKDTFCFGDAMTLKERSHDGATIQLRYSPSCRAVWAREVDGNVHDFLWVRNSNGEQETAHINSGTDNYTFMVNDMNITAAACMTLYKQTAYTCTPAA